MPSRAEELRQARAHIEQARKRFLFVAPIEWSLLVALPGLRSTCRFAGRRDLLVVNESQETSQQPSPTQGT